VHLSRKILDLISKEYGSSFYLLDSVRFEENYNNLYKAFNGFYDETIIAYSYKTNYIPRFCEIIREKGGVAEVVSSMEMSLALKLGVPSDKIFFNGPYKENSYVESLLTKGGTVNLDSFSELKGISDIADSHKGNPLNLGIRCNFEVYDGVLSRFGFDVDSQEFLYAIDLIDHHPKLRLVGLHCHFASRSLECWQNRTNGMLDVIDKHFNHRLGNLLHVSLGGGMYGPMPDELKVQFPVTIPEFKDYALAAAMPFAAYFNDSKGNHRPTLIIEPGTALVADAMKYVCKVNSIKHVRSRTFVSLAGSSYNINPNPNRKNVPIECFPDPVATERQLVRGAYFCGYTCIEGDYLYKDFEGELAVGDFIVFDDAGSYSVVMKPPFILPNVAIVELFPDDHGYKLIKSPETFDDVFSTYVF